MAENPFLLPPGSTPSPGSPPLSPPKPGPTLVPPQTSPPRDPDRYIAIPPSIESATHRIARPETAPTTVQANAPTRAPEQVQLPVQAQPPEQTDLVADPVAEETQLATPAPTPAPSPTPAAIPLADASRASAPSSWTLVLPDGSRVVVDGPILLGRDPAPPVEHPDARSVPLDDPDKTVSKTHAMLAPVGAGHGSIRVQDLYSTNGVAISSGGVRTVLTPGGDGLAVAGSVIELGSFTVRVDVG